MVRAVVTSTQGGVGVTWTGTTLVVTDGSDFPRDGGQFIIEGDPTTVYNYTSVTDGETEDDPDTITTVETAPATLPAGDEFRLTLWPTAVSSVAEVALPESLDDTVPAIIPHALKPYLADGVRDLAEQEAVIIGQRDMAWYVVDILDQPEVVMAELVQSVDDAKAEALEAHGLASEATVAAQDAHNAAVDAQTAADSAATAAGTAQTAADNAAQAAADAAGIAGGKADVLIQSTAPDAAMQKATTLWIDTTGGNNTPKRWDGNAWVVVTDKAATDAAQAAAAAQTTASNAASAAAAAQTTANNAASAAAAAQSAASDAQTTATNALTSANGRNSRVTSTSAPAGTVNPNTGLAWVEGDTWWQWDNTTARNVIGAWTRRSGAWVAEKLTDAVLTSLDVNKLVVSGSARMAQAVVDKIIGDAAFFKVLTADRIQLQAGASVYYDGNFNDAGLSGLRATNSGWTYDANARTMSGTSHLWLTYEAKDEGKTIPLTVGQKYRVRVWGTGLTSGQWTFARRDPSSYVFVGGVEYFSDRMEATFDVVNADSRVNLYKQGTTTATVSRVEVIPLVGGTLIEPGGIGTPHLKATAIDGMTITGATLQTVATANLGVKIDSAGLRAYDSSGNLTVNLSGSGGVIDGVAINGATVTGGVIQTAAWKTAARIYIDSTNGGRILFQDSNALELMALTSLSSGEATFQIRDYTSSTTTAGPIRIRIRASDGINFWGPSGTAQGYIRGESDRLDIWSNQRIAVLAPSVTIGYSAQAGATVQISANSQLLLSGPGSAQIDMPNTGIYTTSTWTQFAIAGPASTRDKWAFRPVTAGGINRNMLYFLGGSANMPSTTIAANLMMDSNGGIWLSTSARRFKRDIRDIDTDPYRILDVPVRDWVDATAAMDDDTYSTRTPGVVAEEVEDAGLAAFVTYNEDGQTSGVMYDRLPLLLIPVVRDLRARLDRLENPS